MEKPKRDTKLICLSLSDARFIFYIYTLALVVGLVLTVALMRIFFESQHREITSLLCGMSTSMVGSSIFYSRKLYRSCINTNYSFVRDNLPDGDPQQLQRLGSKSYFLLRPLFSLAFALVVCCVWRVGVSASGEGEPKLGTGFLYTSLLLGFVSGFLAGRVLTGLEGYGAHRLEAILAADDQ